MNREEAYNAYRAHTEKFCKDGPFFWPDIEVAFDAGWDAKAESLKQATLFVEPQPNTTEELLKLMEKLKANREAVGPSGSYTFMAKPENLIAAIWDAWPVKKARGAAIPAIAKALKKRGGELLNDVIAYKEAYATWPAEERLFLPMCSTWMNQERWLDDRQTWIKGAAAAPSQFSRSY